MPSEATTVPTTVEWTLRNARRKDERHYEQSELSIEGEARLLGIARQAGDVLTAADFDWDRLTEMFEPGKPMDWPYVFRLLDLVIERAPDIITDMALVLLGIFPTTEDGQPNPQYNDERAFIRGAVNTSRFSAMLQVFADQNDYRRLAGPFWNRLFALGEQALGPMTGAPQTSDDETGPVRLANSLQPDTADDDTSSEPSQLPTSATR